jgi:hypothetical protein
MKRAELDQLISQFEGEAVLGEAGKSLVPITAYALRRFLQEWDGEETLVSEQDHAWYIVHFSRPDKLPDPHADRWLSVGEASPLYAELRRCHAESLEELRRRLLGL